MFYFLLISLVAIFIFLFFSFAYDDKSTKNKFILAAGITVMITLLVIGLFSETADKIFYETNLNQICEAQMRLTKKDACTIPVQVSFKGEEVNIFPIIEK